MASDVGDIWRRTATSTEEVLPPVRSKSRIGSSRKYAIATSRTTPRLIFLFLARVEAYFCCDLRDDDLTLLIVEEISNVSHNEITTIANGTIYIFVFEKLFELLTKSCC